jgi:hypothetical protein
MIIIPVENLKAFHLIPLIVKTLILILKNIGLNCGMRLMRVAGWRKVMLIHLNRQPNWSCAVIDDANQVPSFNDILNAIA